MEPLESNIGSNSTMALAVKVKASSTNGTNFLATPNTALTPTSQSSVPLNSKLLTRTGPTSGLPRHGTGGSVLTWSTFTVTTTVPSSKLKSHTLLPTETQILLLTPIATLNHTPLQLTPIQALAQTPLTQTLRLTVTGDTTGNSQQKLNTSPTITNSISGKTMR